VANAPAFAATPHTGAIIVPATLDTSTTAPTNVATVYTAGGSGSRIDVVRITQVAATTAAGVLNLFLFDGTTYHLLDTYTYGSSSGAPSTTAGVQPIDIYYQNLILQSGWSLRCTVTTATGQSAFKVIGFGGDF